MRAAIYKLDSFTSKLFAGNPAAVVVLQMFPQASTLQAIAAENNLPETAFIVPAGSDYRLRWFTPTMEVPFCGHATLASAAVVMNILEPTRDDVGFQTQSGPLFVRRTQSGYLMDFPARTLEPAKVPADLVTAIGATPLELFRDNLNNYLALLTDAACVRTLTPNLRAIAALECIGVIVTAGGDENYDFVSRYFAPAKGIPEDPVTGGAHCALTPYWTRRLRKSSLWAYQASSRGGTIRCQLAGDRVLLEGDCVLYLRGEIDF